MPNTNSDIWAQHSRKWGAVGLPQRPCGQDIEIIFEMIRRGLLSDATCRVGEIEQPHLAGILGVTPELVQGAWPSNTVIQAFDQNSEMIQKHWRAHPDRPSTVTQTDWHALPVDSEIFSVFIGDGCTTQFPRADYYRAFFQEMRRVVRPAGKVIMRCFVRPAVSAPQQDIVEAALSGRISSFGALKWQIAFSLTNPETAEIKVLDIARVFDELFPDRQALAQSAGWPLETINTIDTYKNQNTTYTFPTLLQLEALAEPYFSITDIQNGSYELAESCPIICFSKRKQVNQ